MPIFGKDEPSELGQLHEVVQSPAANVAKLEPTGIGSGIGAVVSGAHAAELAMDGKTDQAKEVAKDAGLDALGALPAVGKLATAGKLGKVGSSVGKVIGAESSLAKIVGTERAAGEGISIGRALDAASLLKKI